MSAAAVDTAQSQPMSVWRDPELRSTLRFLLIPAAIVVPVSTGTSLPPFVLYGLAAIMALVVAVKCFRSADLLLALLLIYLPISRLFVAAIVPGINGTNLLLIALLGTWFLLSRRNDRPMFASIPGSRLMMCYAIFTSLSAVPSLLTVGSKFLAGMEGYKSWIEQMILYFAVAGLIKDGRMARRVAVYAMLASLVGIAFGAQEMLEKMDFSNIEKSRVEGPMLQPNEYGGFVITNLCPFLALAAMSFPRLRSLWFIPIVGLGLKVALATFSRGALLGLIPAALLIGYLRGKRFLFFGAIAAIVIGVAFPQMLPQSITDRFSQTQELKADASEQLDKSSADRLILWQAAIDMIIESPILGKGFGMFPYLKAQYTAIPVPVSDTHNMYLWIASQMGLPALFLFLLISARMALSGLQIFQSQRDEFGKALGASIIAMVAAWAVINMFGSRMQSIETCALFWVYFAVSGHLAAERRTVAVPAIADAAEPLVEPISQQRVLDAR